MVVDTITVMIDVMIAVTATLMPATSDVSHISFDDVVTMVVVYS